MITEFQLKRHKRKPVINMTSLIDVLFLLLIFFMVTSTFVKESSLKVDLPEAEGQKGSMRLKSVDVVVTLDQQIMVNGNPVTREALKPKVEEALILLNDASAVVKFIVDQGVAYGFAIEIMGELKAAGVKTVLAITEQKSGSGEAE